MRLSGRRKALTLMSLTTYEVAVILVHINIRCSRLDDVLILDQFSIIQVHTSITLAVSNYIVKPKKIVDSLEEHGHVNL